MEVQKNPQQKLNWPFKKIVLSAIGGILVLYLSVMTYLYFYPALDFTIELPTNPPSVLEPKQQSIQTHVYLIPGNGLGQFEFFIIPSSRTNFYANVNGGALVEKRTKGQPICSNTATVTCVTIVTPHGQQYILSTTKNGDNTIASRSIYFNRGQTAISIELTEQLSTLDRGTINTYIDSFRPVYKAFTVNHFTPGA